MQVTIDEKKKTMTIVLPLQEPTASKSGNTLIIATTSGSKVTEAKINGKPVTVGLNAWIKP